MRMINKKLHTRGLSHLLRRTVAFVLALSMTLPMAATAMAATSLSSGTPYIQVTEPNSEFPTIEIQTNFVRSEYGTLTGTMELALRVGPAQDGTPVTFQSLATTLQFNTELFKPISWTWTADLDAEDEETDHTIDLKTGQTSYYRVQLPAMKDDTQAGTGAIAQCGILSPEDAEDLEMSTGVANGDQALLFFKAECYNTTLTLPQMTTLAVIRFQVNPDLMAHISIDRNPEAPTQFLVYADQGLEDGDHISDAAKLNTVAQAIAGLTTPATEYFTAVGFALDGDIYNSESDAGMALQYYTSSNRYYFVPAEDDVLANQDAAKVQWSQVEIPRGSGQKYDLEVPDTLNTDEMVLAQDPALQAGDAGKYSYTSNLVPAKNISFPVVSQMSFADKGVDLDRFSVLVFVDWDNTLLGTLVVPKYENVATLVNDYVTANFVHKDLKTPTAEQMASLAREDTYRGKYPYDKPRAEDDSAGAAFTVPESEIKPLTGKLDYAVLRRPMERATDDEGNLTTANTWTQKLNADGETYYDTNAAYAYCWAKCTADNYADTWTTLGSAGELESYAVSDGAVAVTSTDANFEIADLVTGLGKNDSTVFLKAIYEPGDSLLSRGYTYRLCTYPAYNKLNSGVNAAASGAAYSVFVQFERANDDDGTVRGTTRMREPYLRQQTTTDLRWEENEELGVKNDLPNASRTETAGRTKTTYTKVDVTNTEVMDISLTLSARQNKIDYYLTEGYLGNFVAGGERTVTNLNRSDHIFTSANYDKFAKAQANFLVDNYNYYVAGESEEGDPDSHFFDVVQFADKSGSHGFVLYGTLNQLMEQATRCNNGEITSDEFLDYVSLDVLNDANLRRDQGGTALTIQDLADPSIFPTSINVPQKLLDAAKAAATHKGDDNYWDSRLDCARLTYHQIQWFILTENLLSPTVAEDSSHLLGFCHLHAACAATTSKKPKNWSEIIAAAQGDTDAQDTISQLTAAEVEALTHLRASSDGTEFKTSSEFKNAVVRAVASLNLAGQALTWENIQYAILHPAYSPADGGPAPIYPSAAETATYWWYDGNSVSFTSWEYLAEVVGHVINGINFPDGVRHTPTAKLDRLESVFNTGFNASAWVTATHNLATVYDKATDTPDLTGSFADFQTKLLNAFRALGLSATWEQVQFYILNGRAPGTGNAQDNAEMEGYWWKDGRFKVKDVETLLRAAMTPSGTAWTEFTLDDLYTQPGLQFRKSFAGEKYVQAEFETFKSKVVAYTENGNSRTNDWAHLQYYLLYGDAITSNTDLNRDAAYYWWQDGGDPVTVDFTSIMYQSGESLKSPEDRADAFATALAEAAFRAVYNGCEDSAFSGLTDELIALGRLVSEVDSDVFADMSKPSVSVVKTTMMALMQQTMEDTLGDMQGVTPVTLAVIIAIESITWEDVQLKSLNRAPPEELPDGGWWKTEDKKPAEQNDPWVDFQTLTELVKVIAVAKKNKEDTDAAVAAVKAFLTEDIAKNIGFCKDDGSYYSQAELDAINWGGTTYGTGIGGAGCLASSGDFTLTWYQVEWSLLNDGATLKAKATAEKGVNNSLGSLVPDWVASYGTATASLAFRVDSLAALPQGVTVEVDPQTGLITTISPDTITSLPGGMVQIQHTVTVISPEGQILEITTVIEIYDADGNLITSQTATTEMAEEPQETEPSEEPVCTCGGEDGIHSEDCPLYEAPAGPEDPEDKEPVCTCGSEDDTHTEDCPLYVAPEEPEEPETPETPELDCTCDNEDGIHTEDCPLYEAPEEPEDPDVEPEDPTDPEGPEVSTNPEPTEPECNCDSEDGVHTEGCPLYEEPEEPDEPEVTPEPEPTPDVVPEDPVGSNATPENSTLDTEPPTDYTDDGLTMPSDGDIVSIRASLARLRVLTTNVTMLNTPITSIQQLPPPDPGGPPNVSITWFAHLTTLVNILERRLAI